MYIHVYTYIHMYIYIYIYIYIARFLAPSRHWSACWPAFGSIHLSSHPLRFILAVFFRKCYDAIQSRTTSRTFYPGPFLLFRGRARRLFVCVVFVCCFRVCIVCYCCIFPFIVSC